MILFRHFRLCLGYLRLLRAEPCHALLPQLSDPHAAVPVHARDETAREVVLRDKKITTEKEVVHREKKETVKVNWSFMNRKRERERGDLSR